MRALGLKANMADAHVMDQVENWDRLTFGELFRGLKEQSHWPAELTHDTDQMVNLRNHLAHNLLREFFVAKSLPANYRSGLEELHTWTDLVDDLDARLTAHAESLFPGDNIDEETLALVEAMRPKTWPLTT